VLGKHRRKPPSAEHELLHGTSFTGAKLHRGRSDSIQLGVTRMLASILLELGTVLDFYSVNRFCEHSADAADG